jgi:hypothetical protein
MIKVPVEHLRRAQRLTWWLDGDGHPEVELTLPPGQSFPLEFERLLCEGKVKGQKITLTYEETGARWENPRRLERLGGALVSLPDGTHLKLTVGDEKQVFEGEVRKGVWHIQGSDVLARALELSRQCDEELFLDAGTPELAQAAAQGIESEWKDACAYRVEGSRILVDDPDENRSYMTLFAAEIYLVTPEFQEAFPGLHEALAEREEMQNLWQTSLGNLGTQINKMHGIETGALLLEGKKSRYHRSDLGNVKWLTPEDLELSDEEFARSGYVPLGDLTADSLAGAMMRGYARPGGTAWGAVTVGISGEYIREFFSRCTEGSNLTTTTLPDSEPKPDRKLFKHCLPEQDVKGLLEAHEQELKRRGLTPEPTGQDLAALAQAVDDYLVKWL